MDWNELKKKRHAGTHIDDVILIKTSIIEAAVGPSFLNGDKRIKAWVEADAALALCDSFEEAVSYLQQKV
jgi:hypothetical protein